MTAHSDQSLRPDWGAGQHGLLSLQFVPPLVGGSH